ncbi:MAG: hypothetical protein ACM3ZQ_11400, partial [Bacillota bacterium]
VSCCSGEHSQGKPQGIVTYGAALNALRLWVLGVLKTRGGMAALTTRNEPQRCACNAWWLSGVMV